MVAAGHPGGGNGAGSKPVLTQTRRKLFNLISRGSVRSAEICLRDGPAFRPRACLRQSRIPPRVPRSARFPQKNLPATSTRLILARFHPDGPMVGCSPTRNAGALPGAATRWRTGYRALSRILPDEFSRVPRANGLASFISFAFERDYAAGAWAPRQPENPNVVLLTPGKTPHKRNLLRARFTPSHRLSSVSHACGRRRPHPFATGACS